MLVPWRRRWLLVGPDRLLWGLPDLTLSERTSVINSRSPSARQDDIADLGAPAGAVPTPGVDPVIALAATLQSSGTTAVLVGSGMSSAAGIPTGWSITVDLITRVAAAEGVSAEDLGETPDLWWSRTRGTEPRYDTVLSALAPTDADRQHLLRRYFEAGLDRSAPQPTEAHRVLARLAARGSVPVILTTNFDRLIERALTDEGVAAQVLVDPRATRGMTPLVHSGVTLVKLHGDYAGGQLRNAPGELAEYPPEWRKLLQRVFDEYGLLVVGWSGDYDVALARAVSTGVGRRYAWYWASYRGELSEDARRLVTGRGAHVIKNAGADALMRDVEARVEALDRLAARRRAPSRATYVHTPRDRPSGWSDMPLVLARAVVALSPATTETTGLLDPQARGALLAALTDGGLHKAVKALAAVGDPAHANAQRHPGSPAGPSPEVTGWQAPDGAYQSTTDAVYRLGTDASTGISALLSIRTPQQSIGAEIALICDIGISLTVGPALETVAETLRTALLSLSNEVVNALGTVIPDAATALRWEAHWAAPSSSDSLNRPVPPTAGIDFGAFGAPTRPSVPYGGYAETPDGPATEQSITSFLSRAFATVALDNGYLNPSPVFSET